jgi:energy-coupling factor transporter ATP-binding protein EcfA2
VTQTLQIPIGWRIFPCRRDKTPALSRWQIEACDPDLALGRWLRLLEAPIGAVAPAGCGVIDVDPRHGGDAALAEIEARIGALPATLAADTPSGGWHLYVRLPPGTGGEIKTTAGTLGAGLDTRGAGTGYVIAPPSIGDLGAWTWREPRCEVAELPAVWAEELRARGCITGSTTSQAKSIGDDGVPISRDDLRDLLDKKKMPAALKRAAKALLCGAAYARDGHVHEVQRDLACVLEAHAPRASIESIADLWDESHRRMGADAGWDLERERATLEASLRGARDRRLARRERAIEEVQTRVGVETSRAWRAAGMPDSGAYAWEQIDGWCVQQKMTRAELHHSLILVPNHGDDYYVFCAGSWVAASSRDWRGILQLLAPAIACGWVTITEERDGEIRERTRDDVYAELRALVLEEEYSWSAPHDVYQDMGCRLIHAAAKRNKKIKPQRSEIAERYLREVCASDLAHQRLIRWLSNVDLLSVQLPILYIWGPAGAGKTTIAKAIARLWKDQDRAAEGLTQRFNFALTSSPVVVADEALPSAWQGELGMRRLRSFIGNDMHTIERKYGASSHVKGNARVIATANTNELFSADRATHLTTEDRIAIEARITSVEVCEPPKDGVWAELASVSREEREALYTHLIDEIAEHVLWLCSQEGIQHVGRFGFSDLAARPNEIHLTADHSVVHSVAEWVAKYVTGIEMQRTGGGDDARVPPGSILVRGGTLLVAAAALDGRALWEGYLSSRTPSTRRISTALRALARCADGEAPQQKRYGAGVKYRGYEIDLDKLAAEVAEIDITSEDLIEGCARMQQEAAKCRTI